MSTFTYKDYAIYYALDGREDRPVMVLLNGIMMSTKSWEPFIDSFSKDFRLLRFDMVDQGQSSKTDKAYTQALQVEVFKALLDYLKIEKIFLAGISYGGSIALQFASKYQARIEKMVVLNAVAYTNPWLKAIGDGWNAVASHRDGLAYYHIAIPFIYSPTFYKERLEWMEARKKILVPIFNQPEFLDAMTRLTISAETHDVRESLAHIETPTLVIASEYDYLTPVFEQETIVHSMPKAKLLVFPKTGHASMYEQPELFVASIIGFFKDSTHYDL